VFANSTYEEAFCAHYEYSVDCYIYWENAQTKITKFVDVYVQKMKEEEPRVALTKLRNMSDQLESAQQFYKGTHWSYLIQFFTDQFQAPILQMEEEISALRLEP